MSLLFDDFVSAGEIARPPAHRRQRGLVVLFAGSDVADKDGTIVGDDGSAIISRPIGQIADRLACAGFASIRYDKRYVSGAATVDRDRFDRLDGRALAADGRTALAAARTRADLAHLPIALLGWSQGTTVAMTVAADEPPVRAVVLVAPVIVAPAVNAQAHYRRVGKPYLERFATDDALDADAIARADAGPGGMLAHVFVRMFRGFAPGERVNPLLDVNKDGKISFAEADPIIAGWYADRPGGGLGMDGSDRALKGVASAYRPGTAPLLILQGSNDGSVDPEATRTFADAHRTGGNVKLLQYPGLGHSLALAASPIEDRLLPMEPKPLDDLVRWLKRTLAHSGSTCSTCSPTKGASSAAH